MDFQRKVGMGENPFPKIEMECLELLELLEYREFALDEERMEEARKHLEECQACSERFEGLEQFTTTLGTHLRNQPKVKGQDCPGDSFFAKYVKKQLDSREEEMLKEHLAECDYCFDVTAELFKIHLDADALARVQTPSWLKERVGITTARSQMPWLLTFRNLFAPRLVMVYAAVLVLALAFFIARPYISGDGEINYIVFNPGEPLPVETLFPPEPQLAFLSVQLADALKDFYASTDEEHLNRILEELENQVLKISNRKIESVYIENSLHSQIQNETYRQEQPVLISFPAKTILKIQNAQ